MQIIGPMQSVYHWQGELCESTEFRCVIKSEKRLISSLVQELEQGHPYEVPEILVLDVMDSSLPYREWLQSQLKP